MSESPAIKEAVSVSGMARMVGLSRARFYQLMREGIFPLPSRQNETGRPFFNREQQEQCLEVRRMNQGVNGHVILFYAMRVPSVVSPARTPRRQAQSRQRRVPNQPSRDPIMVELHHGLSQLGLTVGDRDIRAALVAEYPDGHDGVDSADLLRSVFAHLSRRDSPDNVSR